MNNPFTVWTLICPKTFVTRLAKEKRSVKCRMVTFVRDGSGHITVRFFFWNPDAQEWYYMETVTVGSKYIGLKGTIMDAPDARNIWNHLRSKGYLPSA